MSTRSRDLVFAAAQPPVYLTRLVGRARELSELAAALRAARLVSLVGPGGSGKTRLAAALTNEREPRQRGAVAWIDLAPLREPARLDAHVANALGLREQPGLAPDETIVKAIGHLPVLLVLDNCEHVLAACARLVGVLLGACSALRIVTTTRQALGIAGEKAWQVPPLDLPAGDAADLAASGAVRLFVERAGDVVPGFALTPSNTDAVVRICRRLDGLPLALELAAARVKLMPPEQLARRLEGALGVLTSTSQLAQPRHRTLRALFDWSYDLLTEGERTLLLRLSVFAGGFTLDAAERVSGFPPLAADEVLDLLAGLVDRSLVTMREWHGEARYALLETVRAYADERLREVLAGDDPGALGEAPVSHHARYYLDRAERAAPRLRGPDQVEELSRIEAEHDNLRAALRWSIDAGDAEVALRLCTALHDVWRSRGHLTEGRRWCEEALALAGGAAVFRARLLARTAVLTRMLGDHDAAGRMALEAEELARRADAPLALADALTQLGAGLLERGEPGDAAARLEEAIRLWREVGDARGLAAALGIRASIALGAGDVPLARALRLEAVEISCGAGDVEGEAHGSIGLGEVARLEGDLGAARDHSERGLGLFERLGHIWQVASAYQNLGWIAAESGQPDDALRAFEESIERYQASGNPLGLTLCLHGLARVLYEQGESEAAAVALAAASANAFGPGARPASPADVRACERTVALVERALAPEALGRARREGEGMALADGIAFAREKLRALRRGRPGSGTAASIPLPSPLRVERRTPRPPRPDQAAAPDLRVRALGPLQILLGDRPIEGDAFGSSKPRELLVFLLCHPDGCTREQAGVAFWPESSPVQVKNSFHVTLHRLRKALGRPEWLVVAGDRYLVDPALVVDFDAHRFEAAVTAALKERRAEPAIAAFATALTLYQGDFLGGEAAGDWHLAFHDRLRRLYHDALLAHGRLLLAADRCTEAVQSLRTLLARDPLREDACRHLMLCHERAGERVEALRTFESFATLLRTELDAEPGPETLEIKQRLLGAHSA